MSNQNKVCLLQFLKYVKSTSTNANNLQKLKRRLSEAVTQIQDYIECFKRIDLDKKGVIYPKILQNYLINHKSYMDPTAISRYYSKYSHQKPYLAYQDILEGVLPHHDFILVASTLSNVPELSKRQSKFTFSCNKDRIQMIQSFTALVVSQEIKCLHQDYNNMREITKNSQRIGAILWRLLDRNHNNQLTYTEVKKSCEELGVEIQEVDWYNFLYWQLHSYKKTINRQDFMRILNIYEQRKRATSACKIEQFKVENQLYKRAEEDRLRNIRIQRAVQEKLMMMPHLQSVHYFRMAKQEHFPYGQLNIKTQLKGKVGYSKPRQLIKYAVERD